MVLVLGLAALIWFGGGLMKASRQARLTTLAALLGIVILVHLVLPLGHPLRLATGGSAAPWLMFCAAGALIGAYRWGLARLRERVMTREDTQTPPKPAGTFASGELDRYARHIVLRELGGAGQKRLKQSKVLVIGAGGLGSPALQYLAAAGIGQIGVIDADVVDVGNLQRQIIHRDTTIGLPKVFSAEQTMMGLNPYLEVRPYNRRLTSDIAAELFADYDVILDGTDNFETRYLANLTAVQAQKPLVSGALSQWEGQISIFDPHHSGPCYRCIFESAPAPELAPSCAEAGVLGPLPGVVGAMMAVETLKLIAGSGAPLRGEMLIYDALWGETRKIALKARADCPTCHGVGAT